VPAKRGISHRLEKQGTVATSNDKSHPLPRTRAKAEDPVGLHDSTLLPKLLPILVDPRLQLIILLLRLDIVGKPPLQKRRQLVVQIIAVRHPHRFLPAQRTILLLLRLHDDQTPNAKDVSAGELDGSPLDFHAGGAAVVVDLRDVAEDLAVHLCADGFGEVFGEGGVDDLFGDCGFDVEGGAFVELCGITVSIFQGRD
jgi:hypothetical protein